MKKTTIGVEIPEGVGVEVENNTVIVKSERGEISRTFKNPGITISKKDNKIVLTSGSSRRKKIALLGTARAHIKNMISGVTNGITYKLKILYSHFPMSVKVQETQLLIENFLGERYPRKATILDGVSVDVKGQDITVTGIDKEKVSQTAANIEQATSIKDMDPRVFQDGIYITEKDGRLIK